MKLKSLLLIIALSLGSKVFAVDNILNIYLWAGEVPDSIVQQFERETHIKVNYATYDSNETLYAKFKASKNPGYDIIEPSGYYIERMAREGWLQKIDKQKIPNWKHLDPAVLNPDFDPDRTYSVPALWGVTAVFLNTAYYQTKDITTWEDFWSPQYKNKLLLLNDVREVFSMAFFTLHISPNTENPEDIKKAYLKLLTLKPNIKLFAADAVPSIVADDDALIGMAWNGDIFSAKKDNTKLDYIYPKEGFIAWSDNFAIPKNAKHLENAYRFLDFIERPDINAKIILEQGFPTGNLAAKNYLPESMRSSPIIFPPSEVMKRAVWQGDISDEALAVYEKYWELLKLR